MLSAPFSFVSFDVHADSQRLFGAFQDGTEELRLGIGRDPKLFQLRDGADDENAPLRPKTPPDI